MSRVGEVLGGVMANARENISRLAAALVLPAAGVLALGGDHDAYADSGNGNGNPAVEHNLDIHGKAEQAHADSPGQSKKEAAITTTTSTTVLTAEQSSTGSTFAQPEDAGTQSKSPSTPDQDGKGADHGLNNNDKTGPGTDPNNGCGNEPREAAPRDGGRPTEDDNNGHCASKEVVPPTLPPTIVPPIVVSPPMTTTTFVPGNSQPAADTLAANDFVSSHKGEGPDKPVGSAYVAITEVSGTKLQRSKTSEEKLPQTGSENQTREELALAAVGAALLIRRFSSRSNQSVVA